MEKITIKNRDKNKDQIYIDKYIISRIEINPNLIGFTNKGSGHCSD